MRDVHLILHTLLVVELSRSQQCSCVNASVGRPRPMNQSVLISVPVTTEGQTSKQTKAGRQLERRNTHFG